MEGYDRRVASGEKFTAPEVDDGVIRIDNDDDFMWFEREYVKSLMEKNYQERP